MLLDIRLIVKILLIAASAHCDYIAQNAEQQTATKKKEYSAVRCVYAVAVICSHEKMEIYVVISMVSFKSDSVTRFNVSRCH